MTKPASVRILIFDVRNKNIISIPCKLRCRRVSYGSFCSYTRPGNSRNRIAEEQDSAVNPPASCAIVPNRSFGHNAFNYSISTPDDNVLGPAIPISNTGFEAIEGKSRAKLVELKFLAVSGMLRRAVLIPQRIANVLVARQNFINILRQF